MSDENYPESKFPDMKPVNSPPSLWTVNGIGLTIYGARDFDQETGTYVKTHFLAVVFVPLLALGAYRVADAPQGWYFIGRVPLSMLAKLWNLTLVLGIAVTIGLVLWLNHTGSPEYIAGQKLAEAERLATAGELGRAAELHREVAFGATSQARSAQKKFQELLDGPVANADLAEVLKVFAVAVEMHKRFGEPADLAARGTALARKHAANDLRTAVKLTELVLPVAPADADLTALRLELLTTLVARFPEEPGPASELALIYEGRRQYDKCEKLLAPHAKSLGHSEGARILGQIYFAQGKFEPAYSLLQPYAKENLKRLHAAEQKLNGAFVTAQKRILDTIQQGTAPNFDFKQFDRSSRAQQETMARKYLEERMKDDPTIRAAFEERRREDRVVTVAIDLGIVLLQRAQTLAEGEARKKELEKAEKMFLDVQGAAGESDEFRLNLGQVYYWMGKSDQGRKLFDELLAAQKRSADALAKVAAVLREVGAVTDARTVAEEAYHSATDARKKSMIAELRSVMCVDLDDEIAWLKRADASERAIKASLENALGNKAMSEGRDKEAAEHFRHAIELYDAQPKSAASLNNGALAHFARYRVTGDRALLDRGLALIDEAIALKQSGSIVLINAADAVVENALWDVIGNRIDLKTLKKSGSFDLLEFLYTDEAGRDALAEQVRRHAAIAKGRAHYERLLVLAPKNTHAYSRLLRLYHLVRDGDSLRNLQERAAKAELELADINRHTLDFYQGKRDDKLRKELTGVTDRLRETLTAARKVGGATYAVAAANLSRHLIGLDTLGLAVDTHEIVKLAEDAHQAAPSRGTHQQLVYALLQHAQTSLVKQDATYANLSARAKRSLGAPYAVAIGLSHVGSTRKMCLANADVQRALGLLRETRTLFPKQGDALTWTMLRAAFPDDAAHVEKQLKANELDRLENQINLRLNPLNAGSAVQEYWVMSLTGQEAQGLELLRRLAAQGVPLPFDVK